MFTFCNWYCIQVQDKDGKFIRLIKFLNLLFQVYEKQELQKGWRKKFVLIVKKYTFYLKKKVLVRSRKVYRKTLWFGNFQSLLGYKNVGPDLVVTLSFSKYFQLLL